MHACTPLYVCRRMNGCITVTLPSLSLSVLCRCGCCRPFLTPPFAAIMTTPSNSDAVSSLLQQLVESMLPTVPASAGGGSGRAAAAASEARRQQTAYLQGLGAQLLRHGPKASVDTIDESAVMRHAEKESQTQFPFTQKNRVASVPWPQRAVCLARTHTVPRLLCDVVASCSSHTGTRWHSLGRAIPAAAPQTRGAVRGGGSCGTAAAHASSRQDALLAASAAGACDTDGYTHGVRIAFHRITAYGARAAGATSARSPAAARVTTARSCRRGSACFPLFLPSCAAERQIAACTRLVFHL